MRIEGEHTMVSLEVAGRESDEFSVRVNQIMDQVLQKPFFRFRTNENWQPDVNFYETDDSYLLCLDLAGIDPEKTDIKIDKGMLTISGERNTPSPPSSSLAAKIHVLEIDHGPFSRTVSVPKNVETEEITANYKNGLLWIELPKA